MVTPLLATSSTVDPAISVAVTIEPGGPEIERPFSWNEPSSLTARVTVGGMIDSSVGPVSTG